MRESHDRQVPYDKGLRSEHANTVACAAFGLSIASWFTPHKVEQEDLARADRWGISSPPGPATWFGFGQALEQYERSVISLGR
ncbi:hypothetical protein [Streptomyces bauhiniae]|uniref:hypothetical protein n=1 Tax=Streptomyces bauhiniae TaxID=2340725 RepID=UPI0036653951